MALTTSDCVLLETFLEHVLSIASTTFYSMPSSELLSAATETFYDIAPNSEKTHEPLSISGVYLTLADSWKIVGLFSAFRWAEKKLLLETIHSSHHLKTVAMSVTASSTGSSIVRGQSIRTPCRLQPNTQGLQLPVAVPCRLQLRGCS